MNLDVGTTTQAEEPVLSEALLQAVPDALVLTDGEGTIRRWTGAAAAVFGYSAREALGQPFHFVFRPDLRQPTCDRVVEAIQEIGEYFDVVPCLRKDGTEVRAETTFRKVFEAGGKPLGMVGVFRDAGWRRRGLDGLGRMQDRLERRIEASEARHRRTEVALQESEARFRMIVEAMPMPIAIARASDGRFLYMNERCAAGLGFSVKEGLRRRTSEFYADPADRAVVMEKLRESGRLSHYEFRGKRADGSLVWVVGSFRKMVFEGEPAVLAGFYDVTARRQAEDRLRMLSRAVEQSASIVMIADLQGRIEYVNPKFTQVTGYGAGEARGRNPRFLKSGESSDEEYRRLWETIRAGGEWRGEFHNRKKDGTLYWVSASISAVKDTSGRITHFLAIQEDITERKQVEAAFQESQNRLEGLIEHLPEGVCLLDDEGGVVLANQAARASLEALANASVGERVSRLGGRSLKAVLEPREDGMPHELTVKGPPPRIFEVQARPVPGLQGRNRWALRIEDVTRERELKERMQERDRLASVGQLAAGIAHDFNNLLTVIVGIAQLLELQEDVPEQAKQDLKSIFAQGQRAAQLIRQVLDFSRKTVVERQAVDLGPFLKEAVKMLSRTLPETIRIEMDFAEGDCIVRASPVQLQEVLTNLALNARDAMPEGGVLRIGLSRLRVGRGKPAPVPGMGPGKWVVWSVSDTGVGMPQEVVKRIYEPFFTTKPPGEGTGLGLAQVYGIVKQHVGEIDVESEVGKGSTFRIYLQLVATPPVQTPETEPDVLPGRGETILVVEDHDDVRQAVKMMLECLNYQVLTAAEGRAALEVYGRQRKEIALVLTDVVMPGMGGEELFEALRAMETGVPVVVMTGYASGKQVRTRLLQKADGCLQKPLALRPVAKLFHGILERRRKPLENGEGFRKADAGDP